MRVIEARDRDRIYEIRVLRVDNLFYGSITLLIIIVINAGSNRDGV